MNCEKCGTDEGVVETLYSWETPPGRYGFGDPDEEERLKDVPVHRVCPRCREADAAAYVAANPISSTDVMSCTACGVDVQRGDMKLFECTSGAALVCPECHAWGRSPFGDRGRA